MPAPVNKPVRRERQGVSTRCLRQSLETCCLLSRDPSPSPAPLPSPHLWGETTPSNKNKSIFSSVGPQMSSVGVVLRLPRTRGAACPATPLRRSPATLARGHLPGLRVLTLARPRRRTCSDRACRPLPPGAAAPPRAPGAHLPGVHCAWPPPPGPRPLSLAVAPLAPVRRAQEAGLGRKNISGRGRPTRCQLRSLPLEEPQLPRRRSPRSRRDRRTRSPPLPRARGTAQVSRARGTPSLRFSTKTAEGGVLGRLQPSTLERLTVPLAAPLLPQAQI